MMNSCRRGLVIVAAFLACVVHAFTPILHLYSRPATTLLLKSSNDNIDVLEQAKQDALVEALVCPDASSTTLLKTCLVGRGSVGSNTTRSQCLVLSTNPPAQSDDSSSTPTSALWVPLSTTFANRQLKLVSFAYRNMPISKSVCLGLNTLLVNRDGGLFDELPWSAWSVDPQKRNRDAAGNPISQKQHLGKRDAYNRFLGKDWQGRSVGLGNLALRLKYALQPDITKEEDDETAVSLAQRILELQLKEYQMELAECDYQLAIARTNSESEESIDELIETKDAIQEQIHQAQESLKQMSASDKKDDDSSAFYMQLLDRIANQTTDFGKNAAPYRGAMGYAPMLDSKQDVDDSVLPYSSPYDLLKEIIGNQLNADVIGVVLENTSLLRGTLALGGALVLQRQTATETTTILGEQVTVSNPNQDYGNEGGTGGATMVVECDADEAVGVALAYNVPIRVESQIWERSSLLGAPVISKEESRDVREAIPLWETLDDDITFVVEGQNSSSSSDNVSPLSIPRTTASLYDSLFEPRNDDESSSSRSSSFSMFPTDNPIQSLAEYDALKNEDKAKVLLSMSNFDGSKLPRPRVLQQAQLQGKPNPLDAMLLPLVDESVRRQYKIRNAKRRGDQEAVEELLQSRSPRQVAKEKAEQARNVGQEDVADWWESEAELYGDLRADVTQDEGSYSRFLDKDEWYERDRQARVKNLKKSSFGTLLDGLE